MSIVEGAFTYPVRFTKLPLGCVAILRSTDQGHTSVLWCINSFASGKANTAGIARQDGVGRGGTKERH